MVRLEGNLSLKNPVTPPGIDPGTVRLVAQLLNNYAKPGPKILRYRGLIKMTTRAHCITSLLELLLGQCQPL